MVGMVEGVDLSSRSGMLARTTDSISGPQGARSRKQEARSKMVEDGKKKEPRLKELRIWRNNRVAAFRGDSR